MIWKEEGDDKGKRERELLVPVVGEQAAQQPTDSEHNARRCNETDKMDITRAITAVGGMGKDSATESIGHSTNGRETSNAERDSDTMTENATTENNEWRKHW